MNGNTGGSSSFFTGSCHDDLVANPSATPTSAVGVCGTDVSSNTLLSVINHTSVRLQAALVDFGFQPATVPIETLGTPDAVLAVGIEPVGIDLLNRMDGVTFKDARANVVRGRYGNVEVTFIGKEEVELGQSSLTPGFAQPGQDATRLRQVMGGVNWRANRYVRVSFNTTSRTGRTRPWRWARARWPIPTASGGAAWRRSSDLSRWTPARRRRCSAAADFQPATGRDQSPGSGEHEHHARRLGHRCEGNPAKHIV